MTRKTEAEELIREENKKRKIISDSTSWVNEKSSSSEIKSILNSVEVNENDFYSELPGRRSFGGFNPSVERLYTSHFDSISSISREKEIVASLDQLVSLPRGPNQVALLHFLMII